MRRRPVHALLCIFFCTACAAGPEGDPAADDGSAASDPDLALTSSVLGNAGFEDGFTGWTRVAPTGLSTVTHSGSSSAKLSASTGRLARTLTGLTGGTKYTLSAWVLGYARIGVSNYGGSAVSSSQNAGSWTQVTVSFTTGSSSTSADIYAAWVSGGDARIDDFKIVASCAYPSQLLDLSSWKLQLPFGSPTVEVKQPDLATYQHDPDFRPSSSCSAVRLRAPTSGTTTSGAEFPRAELREMTDGGSQASWSTTSGTHRLFIDEAVTALPRGRKAIVVGQIHNGKNDVMVVRLDGSTLSVKSDGMSGHTLDSNYRLGKRFTIEIVASGGVIQIYYNGGSTPAFQFSRSSSTCFFKAGAYTQSNCNTESANAATCGTDDYGEVEMYDVWVRHQ